MVDQLGLMHAGLRCLRAAKQDAWTLSFHACNLDPRTRVSFVEWCDKTVSALQTGQSFEPEHELDKHALLPSWRHGMMPVEKKQVRATVVRHGGCTVACVDELRVVSHVALKDVQNAHVCVECALECPAQLDMLALEEASLEVAESEEATEAELNVESVTAGASHWQLKPDDHAGEKLFRHMSLKRETATVLISSLPRCLDVATSKTNREVLKKALELIDGKNPVAKRKLMRDAGGDAATQRLAKSRSGIVNDPARMDRMENGQQLKALLADVCHREQVARQSSWSREEMP
jgi:hypothetical protein